MKSRRLTANGQMRAVNHPASHRRPNQVADAPAKSQELPIMGVLQAKRGEDIASDPLSVAPLLAIGMLDPEPPAQAEGAELRFG